jgi:hypothetical protein
MSTMPSKVPKRKAPSDDIPPQDDNPEKQPSKDLASCDNMPSQDENPQERTSKGLVSSDDLPPQEESLQEHTSEYLASSDILPPQEESLQERTSEYLAPSEDIAPQEYNPQECTSDNEPAHASNLPPLHPDQDVDGNERVAQEEVASGDDMSQGEVAGGDELLTWANWIVKGCEHLNQEGHCHNNAFYTLLKHYLDYDYTTILLTKAKYDKIHQFCIDLADGSDA